MIAKAEWGTRRTCQGCAAPFYDLQKNPIICPNCQTPYEFLTSSRGRRGRHAIVDEGKFAAVEDLGLVDPLNLSDDLGADDAAGLMDDEDDLDGGLSDMGDVLDHNEEDH